MRSLDILGSALALFWMFWLAVFPAPALFHPVKSLVPGIGPNKAEVLGERASRPRALKVYKHSKVRPGVRPKAAPFCAS